MRVLGLLLLNSLTQYTGFTINQLHNLFLMDLTDISINFNEILLIS